MDYELEARYLERASLKTTIPEFHVSSKLFRNENLKLPISQPRMQTKNLLFSFHNFTNEYHNNNNNNNNCVKKI